MRYRSVDRILPEHVGRRVTVRHRAEGGGSTDVVGVLEHADITSVTVRPATGAPVTIGRADVVAARVHPAPELRNPENPAPG